MRFHTIKLTPANWIRYLDRSVYSFEARSYLSRLPDETGGADIAYLLNICNYMSPSITHTFRQRGIPIALQLGDSHTEALQVSDDKTFIHLLQTKLVRNTGREIRTINAGRNGATPAYYIHLSNFYNSFMDPDYVIIEFNEIDEDFIALMFDKTKEFYVKKEGAEYVTVTNFRDYYIWRMFPLLKVIKPFVAFSTFKIALDKIPMMLEQHRNHGALAGQECMPAVDYADIVDWTLRTLKNAYPKMTILYLTLNKSESNVEALLKSAANKYGIDLVNTSDVFSYYYKSNCQPVNWFDNTMPGIGHINEIEHVLVADCLADYFMRKVLR